jgi:hypothetical protein
MQVTPAVALSCRNDDQSVSDRKVELCHLKRPYLDSAVILVAALRNHQPNGRWKIAKVSTRESAMSFWVAPQRVALQRCVNRAIRPSEGLLPILV